ncbi:MAG: hypothetical protein HY667_01215 [Chloroflexi bacterium]|nr:hypothetical protein [Chloroflexota bacterium]
MTNQYDVLSPWAEVDAIPLKGISPRLPDLAGKKIGLFCNSKRASKPILTVVEGKLRERFPTIETSYYVAHEAFTTPQMEGRDRDRFVKWIKGVDAVIGAIGD